MFFSNHRVLVSVLVLTMTAFGAALMAIYGVTLVSIGAIGGMAGLSWMLTRAIVAQGEPNTTVARLMHDRA